MCSPTAGLLAVSVVGAGISAYSSYQQSMAQQQAYDMQAEVAERNAEYSRLRAEDTLERGDRQASDYKRQADRLEGQQRAQYAASGVKLDQGSPLEVQANTEALAEYDAAIIRENAEREAFGQQMQASNQQARSGLLQNRADNENPMMAGTSSLLSGAGSVASQWYNAKRVGNV